MKKDSTTVAWVVCGVGTNVSDLKLLNQINSYLSEQSSSWLQSQLFLAHYNRSKLKTDSSQNQKKKKLSTKKKSTDEAMNATWFSSSYSYWNNLFCHFYFICLPPYLALKSKDATLKLRQGTVHKRRRQFFFLMTPPSSANFDWHLTPPHTIFI